MGVVHRREMRAWSGLAVVAFAALSCGGARLVPQTHVGRIQLFQPGNPQANEFFRAIHTMQLALNESERVRMRVHTQLAVSLNLTGVADLVTVASAVRSRIERMRQDGVTLRIDVALDEPTPPSASSAPASAPPAGSPSPLPSSGSPSPSPSPSPTPSSGSPSPSPTPSSGSPSPSPPPSSSSPPPPLSLAHGGSFPLPQEQIERRVHVRITAASGTIAVADAPVLTAIERALRGAIALRRRMDRMASAVPDLRAAAVMMMRTPPTSAWTNEFRDAVEFLDGVPLRAAAQSALSQEAAAEIQAATLLNLDE